MRECHVLPRHVSDLLMPLRAMIASMSAPDRMPQIEVSLGEGVTALVLICSIIVHIYAAIWVKGSLTAMLRGYVTAGWAWKHHRAWFREQIRK
ncbi:hypothetical protein G6F57_023704 [Rhizopus arrhizus]|nr:hypothetical protein G6F57_023704 [Rhizopus arrhizus]